MRKLFDEKDENGEVEEIKLVPVCEDCNGEGVVETGWGDNIRLVKCHCQKAREIDFETDNTEYHDGELQR